MKNIDKIRQMTVDELAELLCWVDYTLCEKCLANDYCDILDNNDTCGETVKKWLLKECEE